MFSGIVGPGIVEKLGKKGSSSRLSVNLGRMAKSVRVGDSVSVNGVCLTVAGRRGKAVIFDVMPETIKKTNLGNLSRQQRVNVELPLRANDRMGGHLILGHSDGTGKILRKEKDGRNAKLWIQSAPALTELMVPKGAVAVDGVSMTLVDVEKGRFSVCVIPHTLKTTTLGSKKAGDALNIETDIIGKYVKQFLQGMKQGFLKSDSRF